MTNFEALFNITSGDNFSDPKASSLYNVETLKYLLEVGEASINIMETDQQDVSFEEAILTRQFDWIMLSNTLGFCLSVEPSECDCKQTYMIYLWLDTLFKETFQRQIEGGNVELGVMPTLGQLAFEQNMNIMRLEFPAIVYGHGLQNLTSTLTCLEFYD